MNPQVSTPPNAQLGICVVIPCFNEPDLLASLHSLLACHPTERSAEVIVVINSGELHGSEIRLQNQKTLAEATNWLRSLSNPWLPIHFIHADELPAKHAGVGLARKIGMDEAVARFDQLNTDGIIACFDADSTCDPNYFVALEQHFRQHPKTPGCAIHFEHPLEGNEPAEVYDAIVQYELHLRYYRQALLYCGLPYAFHTIGSSMAVRSSAYQKQGGMNKRKAGEDFYFLHKIIDLGNFTELKTTRVIPSPRVSNRVPFGTGRAVGDFISAGETIRKTYSLQSFEWIRKFVSELDRLYVCELSELPLIANDSDHGLTSLRFFEMEGLPVALQEIRKNSPSPEAFLRRFLKSFDAFRVLKLVHYLRDSLYPDVPVIQAAVELLRYLEVPLETDDSHQLLNHYRKLDRL